MSNGPVPTVLLVEPHRDSREMYEEFLQHRRLHAIAVDNAADAIIRAREADIVVTGLHLRGEVDGIALIQLLKEDKRTRQTPIIVLTASAMRPEREQAERAGCDLFLRKPCLPSELVSQVLRLLPAAKAPKSRGRVALA